MVPAQPRRGSRVVEPHTRDVVCLGDLRLTSGVVLPDVRLAVETWGSLAADGSNAVLVEHALTGDSHVAPAGPDDAPGWWPGVVGPGGPVDTREHFVVCANVLGGCSGSTGPTSTGPDGQPWGGRFPALTVRDQVEAEALLSDRLGIDRWAAVLGGSLGGTRVLEWVAMHPERVGTAIVLASGARATADQIAWAHAQLAAIRLDPGYRDGDYLREGTDPSRGLAIARAIAHTTYRTAAELEDRFANTTRPADSAAVGRRPPFQVESYLEHHGARLVERFDAATYVLLTEVLSTHDVTRGRGDLASVVAGATGPVVAVAVDSDRLYPAHLSAQIAAAAGERGVLETIHSARGHDGFLAETAQLDAILRRHVPRTGPRAGATGGAISGSVAEVGSQAGSPDRLQEEP